MLQFDHRSSETEAMDDLQCTGEVVNQTLKELEVINRWLGGNQVTLSGVSQLLQAQKPMKKITFVDLGCGGGDMLKLVARWGRKRDIKMLLTGIDANPHIIEFAVNHSQSYPEIQYDTVNIFSEEFRKRKFDIFLCTLFTHHFSDDQLVNLFKWLQRQSSIGAVVNDIHRHWLAFHSIRWLTLLFSRSSMVKSDAPLSVLRAFRRDELEVLLSRAGITNYVLRWKWAFRWQLIIRPQS